MPFNALAGQSDVVAAKSKSKKNLEGTWLVTANPINPPPGFPPSFVALHTYTEDGRIIETSATNPLVKSAAHGEWERTSKNQFTTTFLFFVFDPSGNLALTVKVRSEITVGENIWSGPFEADFLAPDGSLLFTVPGSHQAKCITAEGL